MELVIEKVCKECKSPFEAKRTHTQYCSHKCSSRAYKARARREKKQNSNQQEIKKKENTIVQDLQTVNKRQILSVADTALFLGIGRTTVYRYLHQGTLKASQIGRKTFIKRTDIDAMLDDAPDFKAQLQIVEKKEITEFYTIQEIKEKFNLKESWIYKIIRENDIPKILRKNKSYVSKQHIDKYFQKNTPKVDESIQKWYTTEEIKEKYNMTQTAIYSFVYEKDIPKKKDGRRTLYSQLHFDEARGDSNVLEQQYYTVPEIVEKYNMKSDAVYSFISYHKLPKITDGRTVKILKSAIDKLLTIKL